MPGAAALPMCGGEALRSQRPQCVGCRGCRPDSRSLPFLSVSSAFTAMDIAERIGIVANGISVGDANEAFIDFTMEGYSDWFALVKDGERTIGWLSLEDLVAEDDLGSNTAPVTPISAEELVPSSTPLLDLLPLFEKRRYYFLLTSNQITHMVTFSDLDRLPGKICLFALIAELECRMTEYLLGGSMLGPDPFAPLSEGRLAKARQLYALKYGDREENPGRLLLCTNLIDKVTLLMEDAKIADQLGSVFRDKPKRFLKLMEDVRNEIAHGESILGTLSSPEALNDLVTKVDLMLGVLDDSSAQ
jgi:hypothetical protein